MDELFRFDLGTAVFLQAAEARLKAADAALKELDRTGDPAPFEESYAYWSAQLQVLGEDAGELLEMAAEEYEQGEPCHFNGLVCFLLMEWAVTRLQEMTARHSTDEDLMGRYRTALVTGWQYLMALKTQV